MCYVCLLACARFPACQNVSACLRGMSRPAIRSKHNTTHTAQLFSSFVCARVSSSVGQREGRTRNIAWRQKPIRATHYRRHRSDLFINLTETAISLSNSNLQKPRETLSADDMADFSIDKNNLPGVKEGE